MQSLEKYDNFADKIRKTMEIMRKIILLFALSMMTMSTINAKEKLDLKSISNGDFYGERLAAVKPSSDGETYMQISPDK